MIAPPAGPSTTRPASRLQRVGASSPLAPATPYNASAANNTGRRPELLHSQPLAGADSVMASLRIVSTSLVSMSALGTAAK